MKTITAPRSVMQVAIDGRLMYYRRAGIAQYTRHLAQGLARQMPADAHLSIILDRRDTDTDWLPPDVRVVRAFTPAHHALEPLAMPLELALQRVDVLHSPDFVAPRGRFRKVITIHDLYFMEHPEVMSADGARYYGRTRASAMRADRIIAVSQFTRRDIERLLPGVPAQRIRVVPEAASLPEPTVAHIGAAHPIPSGRYILFVGTFEPRKNLTTLLRALQALPAEVRLVVVGERGWGDTLPGEAANELGVNERVVFAGRLSDEGLDAYFRAARLLVMPSLSEGFGLPVLEAMLRGTPVVCSTAGALPEIAGDAALLHDPLDAAELARLIQRLWSDDALREDYAQRGMRRAQQFSWDIAARETWQVYREALEAR